MIRYNDYKLKVMLHLFRTTGQANDLDVLDYIEEKYGAYPDGFGNLFFDSEQQECWFILRWS